MSLPGNENVLWLQAGAWSQQICAIYIRMLFACIRINIRMSKSLLIVESPTKAKTITKFLGHDYKVVSSFGHIRDLPVREMGVDAEHDFEPKYIIPLKSKTTVAMLKKEAAKVSDIYFATDEDREGEAIAWHLQFILNDEKDKHDFHRIVFHEITESAIRQALAKPRTIDLNLVDAQQARRVLDRLVGYELSPFLWRKVAKGLSAGRVQSAALRLIVEREREIQKFKPEEYWTLDALLQQPTVNSQQLTTNNQQPTIFTAYLFQINDKKLGKLDIKTKEDANKILKDLEGAKYQVENVERKTMKRQPAAPFTTSTLQQESNNRLRFSAKQTMFLAQSLYEGVELGQAGATGLITYMRTDSVNLADKFLNEATDFIRKEFGQDYALSAPRKFKTKSKLAQEAHEAIRPTDVSRRPADLKPFLDNEQYKLYELIWRRTLACQMKEAIIDATTVDVLSNGHHDKYIFRANGSTIKFDGWLKIYPESLAENFLPILKKNDELDLEKLTPKQHFTEPPARYSEATLVKKLEELGIGRPSTYAPTISTLEDRNYIRKEERRLVPQDIALLVNDLLVKHFPQIVDYQFTAKMEDEFDEIANGRLKWVPVLREFYGPFKENLKQKYDQVKKSDLVNEKSDEVCEKCGSPMVIKTSRYGKFLACTGFPKCRNTKPLNNDGAGNSNESRENKNGTDEKNSQAPTVTDQKCEKCGAPMLIRQGKFGKFFACSNFPKCKNTKPLDYSTGVKCPECGQGEIVARRTRTRRTFYACNRYPDCKFAVWSKPTGEKCPTCGSLLVAGGKDKVKCSKKECGYEKEVVISNQ